MTADLNHKNDRLRETINDLVESHPELEVVVRDVASKQPPNPTSEQVQANLQERARHNRGAPGPRAQLRRLNACGPGIV
jgi:hypothetical protein